MKNEGDFYIFMEMMKIPYHNLPIDTKTHEKITDLKERFGFANNSILLNFLITAAFAKDVEMKDVPFDRDDESTDSVIMLLFNANKDFQEFHGSEDYSTISEALSGAVKKYNMNFKMFWL